MTHIKKYIGSLAVLLLFGISTPTTHAAVKWLQTSHNFGAFHEDDGKVSCEFRFVNLGPEEVTIRAARASCGCTTPRFTKQPIAVGDTATIEATFNPTGRPGRFSKTITIDIADGKQSPRQTLTIKGVVIGSSNTLRSRYPIEAGPVKLRSRQLPFGSVTQGHPKSLFVEIYNASSEPISPTWTGVPPYIRIAASDPAIPPGEQAVYSVVLTPSDKCPYGILTDSISFDTNTGAEPFTLEVAAIIEEDFSRLTPEQRKNAPIAKIDPDRVDFGEFPVSAGPVTRTFAIDNTGKSDLLLRRVYTTDAGLTITPTTDKIKKGKSANVMVTVNPAALPSDLLNARIQVITNDPENPILIVRAIGLPIP